MTLFRVMLLMINTNAEKVNVINTVILLLPKVFFYPAFLFYLTLSPYAYPQEYNRASVSVSVDNDDLFGRDYGYTHGLTVNTNSKTDNNIDTYIPAPMQRIATYLLLNDNSQKGWGASLGQKIWTPRNISQVDEQKNDRPYAGLLFVKMNLFEYSPILSNKYSLMLGVIGPQSLAESSQIAMHHIISATEPKGWQQQIKNQLVFSFAYERQNVIWRSESSQNRQYDLSMAWHANLGNFQNEVAFTNTVRWGAQLEQSFASTSLSQGDFVDESVLSTSRQGYFIYLTIEGRYRHDDITIEGSRPSHVYEVNTQHWQSSLASGLVYYYQSWGVSLGVIASTPDYKEDTKSYNTTATFKIFYRI